jgi:anhydro-N-acetylmuramic acid kinase
MKLTNFKNHHVVGVMSGTSLDGLDLAHCTFWHDPAGWHYHVLKANTVPYDPDWKNDLLHAMTAGEKALQYIDRRYGQFIGRLINDFISGSQWTPELIASHGHTIFHQPEKGITMQAGSGKEIASITGITTISDFRKKDVELGGQGAPLVPVGDELLFGEYNYCLNLGGICNVSYARQGIRYAHDIAPCNMILNHLSHRAGMEMDKDGRTGRLGIISPELLTTLNSLPYYSATGPRSLGREWFDAVFFPVISSSSLSLNDLLRTVYEHIAIQVSGSLGNSPDDLVLITGGGAYNTFLLELIKKNTPCKLIIPDPLLIEFKEAIVFAFLGLLRYLGIINCYASVTGARQDSLCGIIHVSRES